jgi:hypothetical protein
MATINRTLFGVDTVTPLVANTYVYAYTSGVQPLTNNEVRIVCDSALAVPTIELPAIASFGGELGVTIIIVDATGSAVTNNILVNVGALSGDRINTSATGWKINANYGNMTLTIGSDGRWVSNGNGSATQ